MFDKKAFLEAIKLPLRLLALAVIPFLVAYLGQLPYEWAAMLSGLLAFIDKYLHELWKADEDKPKGIMPF